MVTLGAPLESQVLPTPVQKLQEKIIFRPWYLEVRKASLFQTWLGLSLVILPSVTSVPNLPAASGSSYSKQEWSPASKRVHPCSVPSMLRRHLLFSRPPLLLSFVFNRSAKRSMVSFSHTCSGCSLVLHNLLAEDTGPLGAAAMRRDTRAGVRPEEGSRARAGRPRSLVGAPRAAPWGGGRATRRRRLSGQGGAGARGPGEVPPAPPPFRAFQNPGPCPPVGQPQGRLPRSGVDG